MNSIVCDLRKVSDARFFWTDQFGNARRLKPKVPTLNGIAVTDDTLMGSIESMRQRAERLNAFDRWEPVCLLRFTRHHVVRLTGKRAQSVWTEWNKRIFGGKQKEKGKA